MVIRYTRSVLRANRFGADKRFHDSPTQPSALKIPSNHHIPEHSAVNAITGGSPESHKSLSAPEAHYHSAACQHPFELALVTILGPEGVFKEKAAEFQ